MPAFEYRQAEEVRDVFARHGVRYLFIGKSGAILLGFPDTTQDVDLFVEKSTANCRALLAALRELGFRLTERSRPPKSSAARFLSNSKMVHSIWISCLRLTASSNLRGLGSGGSRSKVFPSATSTISSRVRRPQAA
jgi:hypothetical protein